MTHALTAGQRTTRWVGPAEYARVHGLSTKTVYRRLRAGLIAGADQPAPGHSYRIPITG